MELFVTTFNEKSEIVKEYVRQKKDRNVKINIRVLNLSWEKKIIFLLKIENIGWEKPKLENIRVKIKK